MAQTLESIDTPRDLDAMEAVVAAGRPAVFRHPEADGELIEAGRKSPDELLGILRSRAGERKVAAARIVPGVRGRLTRADAAGAVAAWSPVGVPLADVIDEMAAPQPDGSRILVRGVPVDEVLGEIDALTRLSLRPEVPGRLWLGNATGCDVRADQFHAILWPFLGRIRIRLFAPSELPHLRPGPLDGTHMNAPLALLDPEAPPDAATAAAVERSLEVELSPGDALFVPVYWWHSFVAQERFGFVAHLWSDLDARRMKGAMGAFWQGMLALRELPPAHREHFERLFEHFVFERNGPPMPHLPAAEQGVVGVPDEQRRVELRRRVLAEGRRLAREALRD